MKLPAELKPERLTAIVDTAEQTPFDLAPMQAEVAKLATGDYSIKGLERFVTIERKAWGDFLSCVGTSRKRFDKVVERMRGYEVKAIVIEGTWEMALADEWEHDLSVRQVVAAIHSWIGLGVPVIMGTDHKTGSAHTRSLLVMAAQRRWREARELVKLASE
jgi:ERCC4-type nuclease